MNVHQLELFYYVARHGGLRSATRHMPYGIRQPTISVQIRELEDDLGKTLFQRRPFQLTPAGQELYDYLRPFFDNLESFANKLRGAGPQTVRLAAPPLVLRDYMPQILGRIRRRFPLLRFLIKEGAQAQVEEWFEAQHIDLAILELDHQRRPGCRVESLLKLPIVLLVNETSPIRAVQDLWTGGRLSHSLIGPWPESVTSRGLGPARPPTDAAVAVDWTSAIEVNSIELIEHYVRHGHGVGLSITVPGKRLPAGLRAVPLPGAPCVEVGALWRGALHPAADALLQEIRKQAHTLEREQSA